MPAEKIAFILGGGPLAVDAANHAQKTHDHLIAIILDGSDISTTDLKLDHDHIFTARPDKLGQIISILKGNHIDKIVMIGAIKRPSIWLIRPDLTTLNLLIKNLFVFLKGGDDVLLKVLKKEASRHDIGLLGLHQIWPEIIATSNDSVNSEVQRPIMDLTMRGWSAAKKHGVDDKGQAICIFQDGTVHKETQAGTDHLIENAAKKSGSGGILVKTSKPQQDLSLDMPTIGLKTFQTLKKYGYKGAVIEENKTILHNKEAVKAFCTENNMFLVVHDHDDEPLR